MPELPRYPSLPVQHTEIYQGGVHVGYRVAVTLQNGDHVHEESYEAVMDAAKAAQIASGTPAEYTAWSLRIIEEQDLVKNANAALDALE